MSRLHRVGDILQLERRAVDIDPLGEYTLIGVYSFGKGIFHREPTAGAQLGSYRFFEIQPGDLVLSNIQAWEAAIAHAGAHDEGCIGTHRFLTYVPVDPEQVDTNYLRYFFLSEPGFTLIQKASPGSVTRNRTLSIERFEALEIPLPAIDEQRRIATHLTRVFYLRERAVAKHVRRGELLAALMPSTLRSLAESRGGTRLAFGEDIEIASGGTPSTDNPDFWGGDIVWVTPADMGRLGAMEIFDSERHITAAGLGGSSAKMVPPGSVVMSSRAPIGHLAIARVHLTTNQGCKIFLPHAGVVPEYMYFLLRARMDEIARAGSGTTFSEVSMRKLKEFSIHVPSRSEQLEVAQRLAWADDHSRELRDKWVGSGRFLEALKVAMLNHVLSN